MRLCFSIQYITHILVSCLIILCKIVTTVASKRNRCSSYNWLYHRRQFISIKWHAIFSMSDSSGRQPSWTEPTQENCLSTDMGDTKSPGKMTQKNCSVVPMQVQTHNILRVINVGLKTRCLQSELIDYYHVCPTWEKLLNYFVSPQGKIDTNLSRSSMATDKL
jgi:hypothetical protein